MKNPLIYPPEALIAGMLCCVAFWGIVGVVLWTIYLIEGAIR